MRRHVDPAEGQETPIGHEKTSSLAGADQLHIPNRALRISLVKDQFVSSLPSWGVCPSPASMPLVTPSRLHSRLKY